jgi:phosphopantetheinyl transferase (holo-ACP synthase)
MAKAKTETATEPSTTKPKAPAKKGQKLKTNTKKRTWKAGFDLLTPEQRRLGGDKGRAVRTGKVWAKKEAFLKTLEQHLGVITAACRAHGMEREDHYRWMKNDEVYRARVEAIGDVTLDFAESKLHKLIDNGDTAATIFYLKTKGKKRGYIEKAELDIVGQINLTWNENKTYENGPDSQTDHSAGLLGGPAD